MNFPRAYIYDSLSVPAAVQSHRALSELIRREARGSLVGVLWGGVHRDARKHYKAGVPTLKRPKARALWRTVKKGDWLVVFSLPALGWLDARDCCQFLAMFLRMGIGILSIKEGIVLPPGSAEATAFVHAIDVIRRTQRIRSQRVKGTRAGRHRDMTWDGYDLGAIEIVQRLHGLGFNRTQICKAIADMGYRRDAAKPSHIAVAEILRQVKVPPGPRDQSITIAGLQRAEVTLLEAAATMAGTSLELWAIDVLGRAAAKRVEKVAGHQPKPYRP